MIRTASANWKGTGLEGSGSLTSQSGLLNATPYSTKLRFENEDGKAGTNPEELIAAAHAGCFNMALSFQLTGAGFPPADLQTTAKLTMNTDGTHFSITSIELDLVGDVPGIDEAKFLELANVAKENCPVSKALASIEITLNAKLK